MRTEQGGILSLRPNTPEWMEWRAQGFGASDIWTAYRTPLAMYLHKAEGVDLYDGDEDFAAWGHEVEGAILRHVCKANGWGLLPPVIMQHPEKPWWGASLDGAAMAESADFSGYEGWAAWGLVGQYAIGPIDAKNRAYGWRDFDADAVVAEAGTCPPSIRMQLMAQTYVMRACGFDVDKGWAAVCIGGRPPIAQRGDYDRDFFEGDVVPAVDELWQRIINRDAPPATGDEAEHRAVAKAHRADEEIIDLGERGAELLRLMDIEKDAIKDREQEQRRLESELRRAMQGYNVALCGDREYVLHTIGGPVFAEKDGVFAVDSSCTKKEERDTVEGQRTQGRGFCKNAPSYDNTSHRYGVRKRRKR